MDTAHVASYVDWQDKRNNLGQKVAHKGKIERKRVQFGWNHVERKLNFTFSIFSPGGRCWWYWCGLCVQLKAIHPRLACVRFPIVHTVYRIVSASHTHSVIINTKYTRSSSNRANPMECRLWLTRDSFILLVSSLFTRWLADFQIFSLGDQVFSKNQLIVKIALLTV